MSKYTLDLIEMETLRNLNSLIHSNHSIHSNGISIIFREVKPLLISLIQESEIVLGAVAWLTDIDILKALSKTKCQIILQKEDFLRPDMDSSSEKYNETILRTHYDNLKFPLKTINFESKILELSYDNIFDIEPVRCFGYFNEKLRHCTPKMHNKFLIFATFDKVTQKIIPKKVWTGSANFTTMSMHSLENCVIIDDEIIAKQYMKEYEYIYSLSETLNWTHSWVSPFHTKGV